MDKPDFNTPNRPLQVTIEASICRKVTFVYCPQAEDFEDAIRDVRMYFENEYGVEVPRRAKYTVEPNPALEKQT